MLIRKVKDLTSWTEEPLPLEQIYSYHNSSPQAFITDHPRHLRLDPHQTGNFRRQPFVEFLSAAMEGIDAKPAISSPLTAPIITLLAIDGKLHLYYQLYCMTPSALAPVKSAFLKLPTVP